MNSFVAIDVETANQHPTSICSVGAVKVIDGVITDTYYQLVRPTPNFYLTHFTRDIHHLSRLDTDSQPTFDQILPSLKEFIADLPLVAHNKNFDSACLKASARAYGLRFPDNPFFCTLQKARRTIPRTICPSFSLPHLAHFLGIPFDNHHDALADAQACAKIALTIL